MTQRKYKQSYRLKAKLREVPDIAEDEVNAMWELYKDYYTSTEKTLFLNDLSQKKKIIMLHDTGNNEIQGFSTIEIFKDKIQGRQVKVIFSGDTIIHPAYWGQRALQNKFVSFIVKEKLKDPLINVYWLLISKGYKTFLLLSKNFIHYWPNPKSPTPSFERKVLDKVCTKKFEDAWQPNLGLLIFKKKKHEKLVSGVAEITSEMFRNHDLIRFFRLRNPKHYEGQELCCLGKIDFSLIVFYPFKLLYHFTAKKLSKN